MKPLDQFRNTKLRFVFTDIDDTLTEDGRLLPEAFAAIWKLYESHIHVIPVTGRPAGWCELIARQWPVAGIIGENGGFYFRYHRPPQSLIPHGVIGEMKRHFVFDEKTRQANQKKLDKIRDEVLKEVPGSAIASDQFSRLMDLAVDFCEDVEPLPDSQVKKIVQIFEKYGAVAKVSSIHVNGWFGNYDKLSMCKEFVRREFGIELPSQGAKFQNESCFVGDSPNDEPMFGYFENSIGVRNIEKFASQLKTPPKFITPSSGGHGFAEVAEIILKN